MTTVSMAQECLAAGGPEGVAAGDPEGQVISVIGVGCRFPAADNPAAFWELLRQGMDGIREVPPDRWDIEAVYDQQPAVPGKMNTRWGGFLENVTDFDPAFFGISAREAEQMDPQQRLLLEVTWEALEDSGQPIDQLANSLTGVFVGISNSDYSRLWRGSFEYLSPYSAIGTSLSIAANRLSYAFDFRGPSIAIDTACSSSLVAAHLACRSLRQGESDLAVVGGVNLILGPEGTITFSQARMMAADGRCKTFDASADGYVRGEGCGVIVLKRLKDALRDGDRVQALIRGSAVNQDGLTNGITAPNGPSQQEVICAALDAAQIAPAEVEYFEAHGTGTPLGDPIEVRSLKAVMMEGRKPDQILRLGSVKTNIGHLEPAAGVAGLIKLILAIQHEQIPPHLHLKKLNPYIDLAPSSGTGAPIEIPRQATPWRQPPGQRVAGISAFGFGGANCHVIVSDYLARRLGPLSRPNRAKRRTGQWSHPTATDERPQHLLPLSARHPQVLAELARRYETHLVEHPEVSLADLCHTAAAARTHLEHRRAILIPGGAESRQSAMAQLHELGRLPTAQNNTAAPRRKRIKTAFLFTGQGAQYPQMARGLFQTQPTFRRLLVDCAKILEKEDVPLLEILFPAADDCQRIHQTAYTQPALFAVEYALAGLWRDWGITPQFAAGHSVGEYVAACLANVFSLEDGLRLVAARARLMQQLPRTGRMIAVAASGEQVEPFLQDYVAAGGPRGHDRVAAAAFNSPRQTVLSGEIEAITEIQQELQRRDFEVTPLNVSHAFHSPLMEPMLDEFHHILTQTPLQPPSGLSIVSNLTGAFAGEELATPEYWRQHLRHAVRFVDSLQTLDEAGVQVYLEVGPRPVLSGLGQACLPNNGAKRIWLPSLRSGQDDWQVMLGSLGRLYERGFSINWKAFDRDYARRVVPAPLYPFQRQRYWAPDQWADKSVSGQPLIAAPSGEVGPVHPLLGRRKLLALESIVYEARINSGSPSYLRDHCLFGQVVFPAAGYAELALAAAREQFPHDEITLEEVSIRQVLVLPSTGGCKLQCVVTPEDEMSAEFRILSQPAVTEEPSKWTLHATGRLLAATDGSETPAAAPSESSEVIDVTDFYQHCRASGLEYGPAFQIIRRLQRTAKEAWAEVSLPKNLSGQQQSSAHDYVLHPALLDACLQAVGSLAPSQRPSQRPADTTYIPVAFSAIRVLQPGLTQVSCRAEITGAWPLAAQGARSGVRPQLTADVTLLDAEGKLAAEITGLTLIQISRRDLQERLHSHILQWLHQETWQEHHHTADDGDHSTNGKATDSASCWLVLSEASSLSDALAAKLRERSQRCVLVTPGSEFQLEGDQATVDPASPEGFRRLLEELKLGPYQPLRGVAYLWGLSQNALADSQQLWSCQGLLHLVQALQEKKLPSSPLAPFGGPRLWIVTQGAQSISPETCPLAAQGARPVQPPQAALWGMSRVISAEIPRLQCTRIDVDTSNGDLAQHLFGQLWSPDRETNIALRDGKKYVARLSSYQSSRREQLELPGDTYKLKLTRYGQLTNLALQPAERQPPAADEVEIAVKASGLNFRDVLRALGMLQEYEKAIGIHSEQDVTFGFECAGVVQHVGDEVSDLQVGDEVIALSTASMASHVTVPHRYVIRKPAKMSFEEAASLPLAYLTAYYGLHRKAGLRKGDRVLIHAAAGGVGQAAVALAHAAGAEIFATASRGKWDFLRSQRIEHVFDSRTLDFADQVLEATGGEGVSVVLNSLNGDYIPRSLKALADGGRFVEIGKIGIWTNEQIVDSRPDATYFPFDLGQEEQQRPGLIAELLAELLPQFEKGRLPALPQETFDVSEAVSAFRHMQQARHRGKVIVRMEAPKPQPGYIRGPNDGGASYLITGGLGALGLEVAGWLVERGARRLVLTGRRQEPPAEAVERINQWKDRGVQVVVRSMDVSRRDDVERVLREIGAESSPLRGVVHAAGVLDDATLQQQSWDRFTRVLAAKVDGGRNLDQLTRSLPLDFFVCFSSMAATLGSPGQSNYAAANAYLDGLAIARRQEGLPGLSINWGPWSGPGMAAGQDQRKWEHIGLGTLAPAEGLLLFERLLEDDASRAAVLPLDWRKFLRQFPKKQHPMLLDELASRFRDLPQNGFGSGRASGAIELSASLAEADPEKRRLLLEDFLAAHTAKTLGASPSQLDRQKPLTEMGLDSLMGIELKNAIEADSGIELTMEDFVAETSIRDLAQRMADKLADTEIAVGRDHCPVGGVDRFGRDNGPNLPPERELSDVPESDYDVTAFPEIREVQQGLSLFQTVGMENPFFHVHERVTDNTTVIGGRTMINFSSYNYLGSSGAAEVNDAAKAAIDQYGSSVSASRIVSGEKTIHGQLERAIADLLGAEDAIVFVGGHATNETTIGHLLNPGDLIVHDELAHNSIVQGCILSGAKRRGFRHNDYQECEQILQNMRTRYKRTLIVTEGVYSMDGDYPDLPRFVDLKRRYKALLMIDEAHSIGTMGRTGRGIVEHFGLNASDVDLLMGTLSKSFASCGGYIAGRRELIQYLKYTAPGFVYSVGLSPPSAAAALAAIGRLKDHPEIVRRCQENSRLFLRLARERGLNTGASNNTPVIPVILGNSLLSLTLSQRLFERGINVQPIFHPAVEESAARLRFFITSEHTQQQIRTTVHATADILADLRSETDEVQSEMAAAATES